MTFFPKRCDKHFVSFIDGMIMILFVFLLFLGKIRIHHVLMNYCFFAVVEGLSAHGSYSSWSMT